MNHVAPHTTIRPMKDIDVTIDQRGGWPLK